MTALQTAGNADAPRRRSRRDPLSRPRYSRVDAVSAWVLLAPALILFTIFIVIPTLAGFALSFASWNFFDSPTFVGVANFAKMFADPVTWQSLGVTMLYVLLGVIPTTLLGFVIAVLVNARLRGIGALRVLYFVPVVLSVAVSSVLWGFLYDARQGPIASAFRALGLNPPSILNSQGLALPGLVIMMIWLGLPIVIILYLAGLQRVPADIYDAAALDGSGPWRTLWSITWPNVAPTTFVVAILEIIGFVAGSLDVSLIMTNGGPLGSTRGLSLYSYQQAFTNQDVGYASALSVLQLVIVVAILAVGRLVVRRLSR